MLLFKQDTSHRLAPAGDVGAARNAKKRGLHIKFIMYSPLRPDIQKIDYTNY